MENLINKLTFTATPASGWFTATWAVIVASGDRLEAAIGMAQACNAGQPINMTDLKTLGLRDC